MFSYSLCWEFPHVRRAKKTAIVLLLASHPKMNPVLEFRENRTTRMKDRNGILKDWISIDQLPVGSSATVMELSNDSLSLKLMEMGLIPGKILKVMKRASYGDPIAIRYGDTTLALRKNEAQKVMVKPLVP